MTEEEITKESVVVGLVFLLLFLSVGNISAFKELERKQDHIVPSYVQAGDIVFMESEGFFSGGHSMSDPSWDHIAIYYGNDTWIETVPVLGVRYGNFSNSKWASIFAYGYVKNANESQRRQAVSFAESQIGKSYQDLNWRKPWSNRTKDPDINSSAWYCSELVWAAYFSVGIDIDKNKWPPNVMPMEISSSKNVEMYPAYKDIPWNQWHPGMYVSWLIRFILSSINN